MYIIVENPPITDIVECGIIPLFVQFLTRDHQCTLQVMSSYIQTIVTTLLLYSLSPAGY